MSRVVKDSHDNYCDGYVAGDGSARVDYVKYKPSSAVISLC